MFKNTVLILLFISAVSYADKVKIKLSQEALEYDFYSHAEVIYFDKETFKKHEQLKADPDYAPHLSREWDYFASVSAKVHSIFDIQDNELQIDVNNPAVAFQVVLYRKMPSWTDQKELGVCSNGSKIKLVAASLNGNSVVDLSSSTDWRFQWPRKTCFAQVEQFS
jgi:hypothetical protein